ncbi:cupin domain-containing protein [Spirillospora sp. CA-294931]|uniref:cupin domain-containing protein n=1 Tax=Spirillospora sp. CA-294931 TaxID=3240042 RepID=UPI003D8E6FB5
MNRSTIPLDVAIVAADDVEPNRRHGGAIRVLLSPSSVTTTAGFMALFDLEPGEHATEHYHPYSDEHVVVTAGELVVVVNGVETKLGPREAALIRRGARHRYENRGQERATAVLFLGPLAPRPDMGHVETEDVAHAELAPPSVGEAP